MENNLKKLSKLNQTNCNDVTIEMKIEEKNTIKHKKVQNIHDYEMGRQHVCQLIYINNMIYAFGWLATLLVHWLQFGMNLVYGSLDVSVGYNYYAYLDVCNAVVNLVLAWSLGASFFVYFFGNQTFRLVALGRRKQFMSNCCFLKPDILKL